MGRTKREQRRRKGRLRSTSYEYVFSSEDENALDDFDEHDVEETATRHARISANLRDTASRRKRRKSVPSPDAADMQQRSDTNERAHVPVGAGNAVLASDNDGSTDSDRLVPETITNIPDVQIEQDDIEGQSKEQEESPAPFNSESHVHEGSPEEEDHAENRDGPSDHEVQGNPSLSALIQLVSSEFPTTREPADEVGNDTDRAINTPTETCNSNTVFNRMSSLMVYEVLLSQMVVNGHTSYSKDQYEDYRTSVGEIANTLGHEVNLPPYDTVMYTMRKKIQSWCFPKTDVIFIEPAYKPRGARRINMVQTSNAGRKPAMDCVRVVLPSEWAKLDVCTYTTYADIFEHHRGEVHEHLSIEYAPVVQWRAPFIGNKLVFWTSFNGTPCIARCGDVIDIPCTATPLQVDRRRSVHDMWFQQNDQEHEDQPYVRAVFCGLWEIGATPAPGTRSDGPAELVSRISNITEHELALHNKLSRPSPNQSAMDTVLESQTRNEPSDTQERSNVQTHLSYSSNVIQLHPGDHCILFRSTKTDESLRASGVRYAEPETTQHCLLVGSPVNQAKGHPAERLVWLNIENSDGSRATIRYIGTSNVSNMCRWVTGRWGTPHKCYKLGNVRNIGFLSDGSRYLVYRFALYMDGFNQSSSTDNRKVGGFYLMPLGFSLEARKNRGAPHVLTLASSTTSYNRAMEAVMDDVCRGVTEGVDGIDPYGRRVRIFLDPVTFFGDYPAVAECSDAYGHTGNAHCTLCTVVKRDTASGAAILGLSMNHSRRPGFMRTDARLNALRESPLHASVYNKLGIKSCTTEKSMSLPLVQLSSRLSRATRPERTVDGSEVSPIMFDSSLSCATVPDHLFNGLVKNVLFVCFKALDSNTRRAAVEKRMATAARDNGLPVTGYIVNWSSGAFKGICGQTMTTYFCLLLCAAPQFDQEYIRTKRRIFCLPRMLQNIMSAVYHWPSVDTDGVEHADMFTVEGRLKYYRHIQVMVVEYLAACDEVMALDKELGAELDKPNTHRMLELAFHTIPTFGHARNCTEMILEGMHQVFKKWLQKSTHQNCHISAVERALTGDWAGRLFALFKIWESGTSRERACSEIGLRRLFLGEEGMLMDESQEGVSEMKATFAANVRRAMRPPVLRMMGKNSHMSLTSARRGSWSVKLTDKLKPEQKPTHIELFRKGRAIFLRHYGLRAGYETSSMTLYRSARYVHSNVYEGKRKSYVFNEIAEGRVVSCPTDCTRDVIKRDECGRGELRKYAVVVVVQGPDDKLWTVAVPLKKESGQREGMAIQQDACVLLELSSSVRRAGMCHVCTDSCTLHPRKLEVVHNGGILDGELYEVWTRENNYPPYMG